MKTIKDLEKIGFLKAGEWFLLEKNNLEFRLIEDDVKEVLYAFVIEESAKIDIIYIGKTIKTLVDRMKGYRKPGPTQNTNIRINGKIREFLSNKIKVCIFVFKQEEDLFFKGMKINLPAGLEDNLIKLFKPKFNLHGNSKIVEETETDEKNVIVNQEKNYENNCYTGIKEASYSNLRGIINLRFIPVEYLPEIGDIVTVHLNDLVFEANFTNGNNNGQFDPRINSTLIGNWLSERIIVNEEFYVKVCNKNTFYFFINA